MLLAMGMFAGSGEAHAQRVVVNGFLHVFGSNASDEIIVQPTTDGLGVFVRINGVLQSYNGTAVFRPGLIIVYGEAGNDDIILRENLSGDSVFDVPGMDGVALYGDEGNDYIDPGKDVGYALLYGGDGADTIVRYYVWLWRSAYPLTPLLNDFDSGEGDRIQAVYSGRRF